MLKFIEEEPEIKATATKNAAKICLIAEHLIDSRDCAKKYEKSCFTIINHCSNTYNRVKLEDISIFLNKPE